MWDLNFVTFAFVVLYAFFGLRLLYIAWRSDSKSSQKKEMEEVWFWFSILISNAHKYIQL